eukprot:4923730-Lingulodinium_polyedra.AAC.1
MQPRTPYQALPLLVTTVTTTTQTFSTSADPTTYKRAPTCDLSPFWFNSMAATRHSMPRGDDQAEPSSSA